jgi:hypothetical protein
MPSDRKMQTGKLQDSKSFGEETRKNFSADYGFREFGGKSL